MRRAKSVVYRPRRRIAHYFLHDVVRALRRLVLREGRRLGFPDDPPQNFFHHALVGDDGR